MKLTNKLFGIVGLLSVLFLSACGSNQATTTAAATTGVCTSGYVYSSTYGCLPQSGYCSTGYGYYNNTCVYVGTTTTTTTTQYQGSCTVGYIQTNYGCATQGICITGYGYINGMCYRATNY